MTAASFWSLLDPAFRIAREESHIDHRVNFCLIIFGFLFGGLFVHTTDLLLPSITSKQVFQVISNKKTDEYKTKQSTDVYSTLKMNSAVRSRLKRNHDGENRFHTPIGDSPMVESKNFIENNEEQTKWHRLLLLIIAVTVHNFPGKRIREKFNRIMFHLTVIIIAEGLAVGVGFGSISSSNNATSAFNQAR